MSHDEYENPLVTRYASREMSHLFSPQYRYSTWRKLWVALAKAERELGLPITEEQVLELVAHVETIDFDRVAVLEESCRHDVVAHIRAFGEDCPSAKEVIHLGATSCFVTDNGDLIQMKAALLLLRPKLIQVIRNLVKYAEKYADLPCLSFTHLQPAQPTTVGKRFCLWIQDLLLDLEALTDCEESLRFLGVKGATGTQASFLSLFDGDQDKVRMLDTLVAKEMGFFKHFLVASQTYTRKVDISIFSVLANFAASSHKFATDLRLLAFMKEVEEPFSASQVGSSAMPYKRNPVRSERICALARFLMSLHANTLHTAANQWLERTLDDSANRRLTLAEGFLAADGLLNLWMEITKDLVIYPKMIEKHLKAELPFLASEEILVRAVQKGKERTLVHERLRVLAKEAADQIKLAGKEGDFLAKVAKDPEVGLSPSELEALVSPDLFVGRARAQVDEFLSSEVEPLLRRYKNEKAQGGEVVV